mgnify:CR=1 FL=1
MDLSNLDFLFIALYFVAVFAVARWAYQKDSAEDYFLGGRNLSWFVIGASLFASNIGSEHLIGLAGDGAKGGVAVAQFEILAGLILLLLAWLFVPFYLKSGVTTMPEFLEMRYGRPARNYLSFISIVSYLLTKISVTIFAGAVVFEAMGFSFWLGASLTVVATGIYTALGGLRAVIYTDTIQVILMIVGAILVSYFGLQQLGGIQAFRAEVPETFFKIWRPSTDSTFPWTGIVLGAPILGIWYWCTDQFIVQRVLSAKNESQARKGSIFAGYLKILPLFIFVFPGMIAFALAEKGFFTMEKADHALPLLISHILPGGVRGLVLAGLLAALMSSLSSVFNSCSTLITYDWYKTRNPQASQKDLFRVGQISTVFLVLMGMAWIPFMQYISSSLFTYIQSVQAYISPPVAAVFLWGLFYKKANLYGAMASLLCGFVLGLLRFVCEIGQAQLDGWLLAITNINFLHFAFLLFVICSLVLVFVSMWTYDSPRESARELMIRGPFKVKDPIDALLSLGLVLIIIIIWVVFS